MPDATSGRGSSLAARVIGGIGLALAMIVGIVVLGRVAATDLAAIVLTSILFAVVLVAILLLGRHRRDWLIALGLPFVLVAAAASVVLGRPLVTDTVVDEQVVAVDEPTASESAVPRSSQAPPRTTPKAPGNVRVASGTFEGIAHPGQGTATIVRTAGGQVKLTFTNFSTDNGPDVRVYLSRGTKASGRGTSHVELGALKGNKGNQQYDVPTSVDLTSIDSIVLWCRAFDVGFIQAPLTPA